MSIGLFIPQCPSMKRFLTQLLLAASLIAPGAYASDANVVGALLAKQLGVAETSLKAAPATLAELQQFAPSAQLDSHDPYVKDYRKVEAGANNGSTLVKWTYRRGQSFAQGFAIFENKKIAGTVIWVRS